MKQNVIDTLRLRALHTKCMTVAEIAETIGVTVSEVEYELREMGYKPIYERDIPEPCKAVTKIKKRSEKA